MPLKGAFLSLHKKNAKISTIESNHAMAISRAGELKTGSDSQRLVSSLSRGGLWFIIKPAEKIFVKTEHYFRQMKSTVNLTRVDITDIVIKSVSDSELLSNCYILVSDSELPGDYIVKDILHDIVHLHVRVRSFSFAKDIIQRQKINTKQSKAKARRSAGAVTSNKRRFIGIVLMLYKRLQKTLTRNAQKCSFSCLCWASVPI